MNRTHVIAATLALPEQAVERTPGGAPVAFRIWRAGDNPTDRGVHVFSKESADLLLEEQAKRENLYSIDVDHLSLNDQSPPEARKAVGWHRLAVRQSADGPELWAVDVEWTDAVRAGLEKKPPEWRYFSPAYDVSKKSGEIVSFLNMALTNNPATWAVTALAVRPREEGRSMKFARIIAALFGADAQRKAEATQILATAKYESLLADIMGADDEKKTAAIAKLAAAFPDDEEEGDDEKKKKKDDDEKAKKAKASSEEATKADAAATKAVADDVEAKKAARALTSIGEQDRRLKELEGINDKNEREKLLATRPDLTATQLKVLADEPLARLPKLLELIEKPKTDLASAGRVTATRGEGRTGSGDGQAYGAQRASRLPPKEHEDLVGRMSGDLPGRGVHWDPEHPNDLVFPQMSREEARRILAGRAKAGTDGPATNPSARPRGTEGGTR